MTNEAVVREPQSRLSYSADMRLPICRHDLTSFSKLQMYIISN